MKNSDVIVWATPVYYYEMAGQMKTLIDRANSLFATGHNFHEVYLITTSAENRKGIAQTVINGLNGWMACLNNVKLSDYVEAGGLEDANEANTNKKFLEQAYNMGKNI